MIDQNLSYYSLKILISFGVGASKGTSGWTFTLSSSQRTMSWFKDPQIAGSHLSDDFKNTNHEKWNIHQQDRTINLQADGSVPAYAL